MILDDIFDNLKNYPFIEKIQICQIHAFNIMKFNHIDILNEKNNIVYPWELECFAELSLLAEGTTASKSFNLSGYNDFNAMINSIRQYIHPHLLQEKQKINFAYDYIMATGLIQFKVQENILIRLFRYKYFFEFHNDKLNMNIKFSEVFDGLEYKDFIELAVLIYFFASLLNNTNDIFRFITLNRLRVINQLKITRQKYIEDQWKKNNYSLENSYYGFNYLFSYPFIEYLGNLFIPLPYLVIDAITDSLLTRMTYGNDRLREIIGKEIAEQYIYDLLKESNIYDEVLSEKPYKTGHNKIYSPDVMIKYEKYVCLIDSKLSTPKLSLRQFSEIDIETTIERYSENIKQIYNKIKDFGLHYYPFRNKEVIKKSNIFGLVILLEDSFISKEYIYKKACDKIGKAYDSEEGMYIRANIKVMGLHEIELHAFNCLNIFTSLIKKRDELSSWNDICIYDNIFFKGAKKQKLNSISQFERYVRSIYKKEVKKLVDAGLINK